MADDAAAPDGELSEATPEAERIEADNLTDAEAETDDADELAGDEPKPTTPTNSPAKVLTRTPTRTPTPVLTRCRPSPACRTFGWPPFSGWWPWWRWRG